MNRILGLILFIGSYLSVGVTHAFEQCYWTGTECEAVLLSSNTIVSSRMCALKDKGSSFTCKSQNNTIRLNLEGVTTDGNHIFGLTKERVRIGRSYIPSEASIPQLIEKGDCYLSDKKINDKMILNHGTLEIIGTRVEKRQAGQPLRCFDDMGNLFVVGFVQKLSLNSLAVPLIRSNPVGALEMNESRSKIDEIQNKCLELKLCQEFLNNGAKSLVTEWGKLLYEKGNELNNEEITDVSEVDSLLTSLEEAISLCNRGKVYLKFSKDKRSGVEGEYDDNASIKDAVFNTIVPGKTKEWLVESQIVNNASKVSVVSENLSQDEIKKIALSIIQRIDSDKIFQDKATITKLATKIYSESAIRSILLKRGASKESVAESVNYIMSEFEICLGGSQTEVAINSCISKFQDSAPIKVGEKLLEDIFKQKIAEKFSNEKVALQSLKIVKDEYYSCVSNWYLTTSKRDNNSLRACIYSGVLKGAELAAREGVEKSVAGEVPSKDDRGKLAKSIFDQVDCSMKNLFRGSKRSINDMNMLLNLETKKFENELNGCVESLTIKAGGEIIEYSIKNNESIRKAISSESERDKFVVGLIKGGYHQCISVQRRNNLSVDPKKCKNFMMGETIVAVFEKSIATKTDDKNVLKSVYKNNEICLRKFREGQEQAIITSSGIDQKKLIGCLSSATGELAGAIVNETVLSEIKKDPSLAKFKIDWSKLEFDPELKQFARKCFKEKMGKLSDITQLGAHAEVVSSECTFLIKKRVLPSIISLVGVSALKPHMSEEEATRVLSRFVATDSDLRKTIKAANNEEELTKVLDKFKEDLTWEGIKTVIVKNIDSYFPKDKVENKKVREEISGFYLSSEFETEIREANRKDNLGPAVDKLTSGLTEMIAKNYISQEIDRQLSNEDEKNRLKSKIVSDVEACFNEKATDVCLKEAKYLAYMKIGSSKMAEEFRPYLSKDVVLLEKAKVEETLKKCFDSNNSPDYETYYKGCLTKEVFKTAKSIGGFATSKYQQLIGNKSEGDALVRDFRNCIDNQENRLIKDSSVVNGQLENIMLLGKEGTDQAIKYIDNCSKDFESKILSNIKLTLLKKSRDKYGDKFQEEISKTVDVALLLRGKSHGEPSETDIDALESTLMGLLANVNESCEMDQVRCQKAISDASATINDYRIKNEIIFTDDIMKTFYNTDLTKLIIKSTISTTLSSKLDDGLKSHFDRYGHLKSALNKISDRGNMNRLFDDIEGQSLLSFVAGQVKLVGADKVAEDKWITDQIVLHLLMDDEDGGFVDTLIDGLVTPKLKDALNKPDIKTWIGLKFGIVKSRNFDWNKIKKTPKGKEASRYFRNEVLLPAMSGKILPLGESEAREKKLNKLIVDAILEMK